MCHALKVPQDLLENPPFELSDADREVLGQTDEEFVPHKWDELNEVVATKDTSNLRRTPTGLANYIRWIRHTLETWDSLGKYIIQNRLQWQNPSPGPVDVSAVIPRTATAANLFADPDDYAVRRNDWPYGCEAGIVHLVVWMKLRIPVDDCLGDPIPEAEVQIETFVEGFRAKIRKAIEKNDTVTDHQITQLPVDVMWFRNRTKWQSVRALEHIHVLLRNVPEQLIHEWTGQWASDTISEKWANDEKI